MTHEYTVLHGGIVLTMDGCAPSDSATRALGRSDVPDAAGRRGTAIAFAGGRIIAVGSDAEVVPLAGPDSRVIDLRGTCVTPGFQDAHAHPLGEGLDARRLLLGGESDMRTALARLSDAASRLDPDAWLVARHDQTRWREARHPTRAELDRAVPDRPILLTHVSGHGVAANSLGLALAGLTHDTPDAVGRWELERDADGEPTGVVLGTEASAPFDAVLPPPSLAERVAALAIAGQRLAADGVTAVSEADLGMSGDLAGELAAYVGAAERGVLPQRVSLMPGLGRLVGPDEDPPLPADLAAGVPDALRERLPLSAAKLKADGALTTRTAWLRQPYADDPANLGRPTNEPAALAERIRRAHAAGWQLAIHAIGDAGIDAVLDGYEAALATAPRPDHRHRVEHAMLLDMPAIQRLRHLGVIASLQPEFVAWAGDTYRARLGQERASRLNRYAALLAAGVPLAFGSDRPVVGGAPLAGIRSALLHAGPSGVRLSSERPPSMAEALHAWTAGAARATFDEQNAGRLAIGMRADLTILSTDPTALPPEAWREGALLPTILATFVGGRLVLGGPEWDR